METVGVVVATYGDFDIWAPFAERAKASVDAQTHAPDDFISYHVDIPHSDGISIGRNRAASKLDTDWLIFLDADDELDPLYIEKMLEGEGDIRQPSTLGFYPDGHEDEYPVLIPEKNLLDGNYIVIGAMCRRDIFKKVQGFRELSLYEDWDLWLRMQEVGATIGKCPEAIYRVYVKPETRNLPDRPKQEYWYHRLRSEALVRRAKM
jgi:GT2 family glycosyltransferase